MADNTFIKDPDSVLDYTVNWETWLDGDTKASIKNFRWFIFLYFGWITYVC